MRREVSYEAHYDNVLDFRQLHKIRHHKMSKWPVNHDVCCSPFSQADHCGKHWLPTRRGRWGGTNLHRPVAVVCIQKQPLCRLNDHPDILPLKDSVWHWFIDALWWHNHVCFSYTSTSSSECNNNDGNNSTDGNNNNNNNCKGNSNRKWQYLAYVVPGEGKCWGRIPPLSDFRVSFN